MPEQKLFDSFQQHQINYELYKHVPLFTAEDAEKVPFEMPGAHSKNLFLKDKKKNYFLVSVLESKRVDLKWLSKLFGSGHFSFGNAQELSDLLGVIPGSVTPFGLLNDTDHQVRFFLDQDFMNHEIVNFHPLRNDMTIGVRLPDFLNYFEKINHKPDIIEIPVVG